MNINNNQNPNKSFILSLLSSPTSSIKLRLLLKILRDVSLLQHV